MEEPPCLPHFRRRRVLGAPVSCLSLPSPDLYVYGQGGWLERRRGLDWLGRRQTADRPTPPPPYGSPRYGDADDRILALEEHALHGIRYSPNRELSVVFGGNEISLLRHVLDVNAGMARIGWAGPLGRGTQRRRSAAGSDTLLVSDWIWDAQWQDDTLLAVGLAHNQVQLWTLHTRTAAGTSATEVFEATCLRVLAGTSRTISYAMHIHDGLVAVGLPGRDILVWAWRRDADEPCHEQRLTGHKGCIHAVTFKHSRRLASASDDRTVRLWERRTVTDRWELQWTAWGHAARCWSVAFSDHGVLSAGEDQTARLWDERTGMPLMVLRGHACRSVWRAASCGSLVATAAHDGSVALYDLRHRGPQGDRVLVPMACENEAVPGTLDSEPRNRTIVQGPHSGNGQGKGTRKAKINFLVGMDFVVRDYDKPCLLVANREGVILERSLAMGTSRTVTSWWDPSKETQDLQADDACCFSVGPLAERAAVGTVKGDIILVDLSQKHPPVIVTLREHLAVQKIAWIEPASFVSLHVKTLALWQWDVEEGTWEQCAVRQIFEPGLKGVPTSCCFDASKVRFVSGDTRGYLALFAATNATENPMPCRPLSTLRAHGREHVTAVTWLQERILSIGNDGCVHECTVLKDDTLVKLKSVAVSSFSGLDRLWGLPTAAGFDVLVGGYYGNIYAIINAATGYELLRVDTGGRQRSIAVAIDTANRSMPRSTITSEASRGTNELQCSCWLAVSNNGNREILVTGSRFLGNGFAWNNSSAFGMHGEVIFDCCLFALSESVVALATASEDCYVRITCFRDGTAFCSELLPSQAGGVRVLDQCQITKWKKTLLVAGGGKLELQFFLLFDGVTEAPSRPGIKHICSGKPSEIAPIDHRINAVAAVEVTGTLGTGAVVAAGDSNGSIFMYIVSEENQKHILGRHLYTDERAILSLGLHLVADRLVLVAGTTGGNVVLFDLTMFLRKEDSEQSRLLAFKAHQVGTNSISIRQKVNEMGDFILQICSGGDDQSIHYCEVLLVLATNLYAKTIRMNNMRGGLSSIRGVAFVTSHGLIACGYDGRLTLFIISDDGLEQLDSWIAVVGDINCLSHLSHENRHMVAIGGAGLEIYESYDNS